MPWCEITTDKHLKVKTFPAWPEGVSKMSLDGGAAPGVAPWMGHLSPTRGAYLKG